MNSSKQTNPAANASSDHTNANSQMNNNVLNQSKDFQTMVSVLKDMGVEDYEPRVINQLLEFSYRYITNLLEDAKAFSLHAAKKNIDSEDIKMAIKSKVDFSFTTTPPRDLLMEISKSKNKNPLPPIKYHAGIRLPPDRFCLHGQNFILKTPNINQHQASANQHSVAQNRPSFSNQPTQLSSVTSRTDSLSLSSVPIKRARADDDDYDI